MARTRLPLAKRLGGQRNFTENQAGLAPPAADALVREGPEGTMNALLILIDTVIDLYIWMLIIWVVMSWLISFNVINTRNRFVYMVGDFLDRVTEPALRPIRRVIPTLGGIDLSPLVLILLLYFLRNLLFEYWPR